MTLPLASVFNMDERSVAMVRPFDDNLKPESVEDAVVLSADADIPLVKVEVAAPCTVRKPVVVAPPKVVRPFAWVPEPMVEEANAVRPLLNWVRVVVAFPAAANG